MTSLAVSLAASMASPAACTASAAACWAAATCACAGLPDGWPLSGTWVCVGEPSVGDDGACAPGLLAWVPGGVLLLGDGSDGADVDALDGELVGDWLPDGPELSPWLEAWVWVDWDDSLDEAWLELWEGLDAELDWSWLVWLGWLGLCGDCCVGGVWPCCPGGDGGAGMLGDDVGCGIEGTGGCTVVDLHPVPTSKADTIAGIKARRNNAALVMVGLPRLKRINVSTGSMNPS